jgi:hypothetical protein
MVADLEYWGQTTPVEVFLEKLAKQYSVNAVRRYGKCKPLSCVRGLPGHPYELVHLYGSVVVYLRCCLFLDCVSPRRLGDGVGLAGRLRNQVR